MTILTGRCNDVVPRPYQPFDKVLGALLDDESAVDRLPPTARFLGRWLPELASPHGAGRLAETATREQLFEAVRDLLDAQMRSPRVGGPDRPLVMLLDDLHSASRESLDLAAFLLAQLAERPLWILATARDGASVEHWMLKAFGSVGAGSVVTSLELGRLDRAAMHEVASWLVGAEEAEPLTDLLWEQCAGLPFHIAELVNFLWDQNVLVAAGGGRWKLAMPAPASLAEGDLRRMLGKRLARLPFSTRRLATLAAVIGQEFEPALIQRTADEHPSVVDVGLEIMLERWILRQNADRWTSNARQRDIVLWTQGARQGRFDFSHKHTREVIYGSVSEERRRLIHGQVAETLLAMHGHALDSVCDQLAFHFEQAGDWERAERYARHAAARARTLFATDVAVHYDAMVRRLCDYQETDPLAAQRIEPETGTFAVP